MSETQNPLSKYLEKRRNPGSHSKFKKEYSNVPLQAEKGNPMSVLKKLTQNHAAKMEHELEQHKKEKSNQWDNCPGNYLMNNASAQLFRCIYSLDKNDTQSFDKHAAHVSNFLAMISDNLNGNPSLKKES